MTTTFKRRIIHSDSEDSDDRPILKKSSAPPAKKPSPPRPKTPSPSTNKSPSPRARESRSRSRSASANPTPAKKAKKQRSRSRSVKITSKRPPKRINGIDVGWYPANTKFSVADQNELKRLGGETLKSTKQLKREIENHENRKEMFAIVRNLKEFKDAHIHHVVERLVRFFRDASKKDDHGETKPARSDELTRALILEKFLQNVSKDIQKEIQYSKITPNNFKHNTYKSYIDHILDGYNFDFGKKIKDESGQEGQFQLNSFGFHNNNKKIKDFRMYLDPYGYATDIDLDNNREKEEFIDLLEAVNKYKNKIVPKAVLHQIFKNGFERVY